MTMHFFLFLTVADLCHKFTQNLVDKKQVIYIYLSMNMICMLKYKYGIYSDLTERLHLYQKRICLFIVMLRLATNITHAYLLLFVMKYWIDYEQRY